MTTYSTASTAIASAGFGLLVLLGAPRRAPNRFLALFLFLIAANQALEVLRQVLPIEGTNVWWHLAAVCAALDPVALYCFAALHPRRNGLWSPIPLGLVLGASALYVVLAAHLAPVATANGGQMVLYSGWAAYTAIVYTVVLVQFGRGIAEEPTRPGARLLFGGLCLAAIPAWPRVLETVHVTLIRNGLVADQAGFVPVGMPAYLVLWVGVPVVGGLVGLWLTRRLPPEARRGAAMALAGGVLLTLVLYAWRGLGELTSPLAPQLDAVLRSAVMHLFPHAVAIRWWLFGLAVSTALIQDQLLGLSLAARRGAARVFVAAAFLLLGLLILAVATLAWGELFAPRPLDILVLGALLVASQRFRTLVDRVAARLYGVPLPGLPAAFAAYRSAARQASREPSEAEAEARLARLRGELGIDVGTARALEAEARGEPGGPLVPGDRLSARYEVGRLLARGSAGRVFAAHDTLLQRDVVVKELLHDDAGNEAAALGEARAAGALQHPNVLVVYDVLHRPGASYIITEPAEGGSLEDRLERGPPLSREEAHAILDGVLAGLAAVHARGLVHRDLKPANVVLLANGAPKLADFGLARLHHAPTIGAGVFGTPAFMSPEQRAGEPATCASDVYAVGLLARRLLAEEPPEMERVLQQALAHDPAQRFPDAARMRAALAHARRAQAPT